MSHALAAALTPIEQGLGPRLVNMDQLLDRVNMLHESISQRAFDIFETRGRTHGHDLDDWLRAEAELFQTLRLDLTESDDALGISVEVPGFGARELEVGVEPRRLAIAGKRRARGPRTAERVIYCERRSNHIFRMLGLPVDVDPTNVRAALQDGILQLALPKIVRSTRVISIERRDWMVRAVDYQSWAAPFTHVLQDRLQGVR
jgi:HSP20 family protein